MLCCDLVSPGHHLPPPAEAAVVSAASAGAAEPPGDRERAPAGGQAAAQGAARPGRRARPADEPPRGSDPRCGGHFQGGRPPSAQDPRRRIRDQAQAHGRRHRGLQLGGHSLLPDRRLLAEAPQALQPGDPQRRAHPLLPAYQGGRGTYVQGPCMVHRSIYHDSPGDPTQKKGTRNTSIRINHARPSLFLK